MDARDRYMNENRTHVTEKTIHNYDRGDADTEPPVTRITRRTAPR